MSESVSNFGERKMYLNCPSCQQPLYTNDLFSSHAWCKNPECKFFVNRYEFEGVKFDICFSIIEDSMLRFAVPKTVTNESQKTVEDQ
jgi:hypothetical protein